MGRQALVAWAAFVALSCASGPSAHAGEDGGAKPAAVAVTAAGVTQEIELEDGSRLLGRIEEVEGDRVLFRSVSGLELVLTPGQIKEVRRVRGDVREGEFRPEDPNRTRLFFGPTARSLPKGRGYVGVYELVMPFVQVGVTDRIIGLHNAAGGSGGSSGAGRDHH